jgi:hypothetical protein
MAGLSAGQLIGWMGTRFASPPGQFGTLTQTRRMQATAISAANTATQPIASGQVAFACPIFGTMTVTLSDANNSGVLDAVGESATVSFKACQLTNDVAADGSLGLTVTRYSSATDLAVNLVFANFTSGDGASLGSSVSVSGNLALSLASASDITVTSESFTTTAAVQGVWQTFSMKDYSAHVVDTGTQVTETLAGTFSSSELSGGSVTISTPTPMVILAVDNYPSQGVMLIRGANQSAVKIEAVSSTQARVSVDANGDGSYESSRLVNWADLG